MSDISVYNNFANLIEVTGRDFRTFKKNLMAIEHPCQEIQYGVKPSGAFYAILKMDRPVTIKPRKKAQGRTEPVKKTKTEAAS